MMQVIPWLFLEAHPHVYIDPLCFHRMQDWVHLVSEDGSMTQHTLAVSFALFKMEQRVCKQGTVAMGILDLNGHQN